MPDYNEVQILALQHQRSHQIEGKVIHEKGLDVVETSGYIYMVSNWAVVYGDESRLAGEQKRVMIPAHRIVMVDVEPDEQ